MANKCGGFLVAMVLVLGATACEGNSDDSQNDGGEYSSGVPGDTTLGELSDADAKMLCDELEEFNSTLAIANLEKEYESPPGSIPFGRAC